MATTTTATGLIGTATNPVTATADPTQVASTAANTPATTAIAPANVASVPQAATVTPRAITDNETVAGNLNSLLSQNSQYMQSARANAQQQAASKGLLNTSLAAGASQKAAIDSALPIAQQDATTYSNAGQSAQNANQDLGQSTHNSLLASAQNKENFGYTTQANQQNIDANVALQNTRLAAESTLQTALKQMDVNIDTARLDAQQVNALSAGMGPIQQQYVSEMATIQRTPDEQMSPAAKTAAIADLQSQLKVQVNAMASLYGFPITWNGATATTGGSTTTGTTPPVVHTSPSATGSTSPTPATDALNAQQSTDAAAVAQAQAILDSNHLSQLRR